jgi:hypothetical protein
MLAMYSPSGEYRAIDSETLEQELRAAGWLNGHEYFSKPQEPVLNPPEAVSVPAKVKKSRKA